MARGTARNTGRDEEKQLSLKTLILVISDTTLVLVFLIGVGLYYLTRPSVRRETTPPSGNANQDIITDNHRIAVLPFKINSALLKKGKILELAVVIGMVLVLVAVLAYIFYCLFYKKAAEDLVQLDEESILVVEESKISDWPQWKKYVLMVVCVLSCFLILWPVVHLYYPVWRAYFMGDSTLEIHEVVHDEPSDDPIKAHDPLNENNVDPIIQHPQQPIQGDALEEKTQQPPAVHKPPDFQKATVEPSIPPSPPPPPPPLIQNTPTAKKFSPPPPPPPPTLPPPPPPGGNPPKPISPQTQNYMPIDVDALRNTKLKKVDMAKEQGKKKFDKDPLDAAFEKIKQHRKEEEDEDVVVEDDDDDAWGDDEECPDDDCVVKQ